MADVRPFSGIHYDINKIGELSSVVSPPYDVIDSQYQDKLYEASPYGMVRIDYGKSFDGDDEGDNKYTRSKDIFEKWKNEGILVRDPAPTIYYVEEDYEGEFGGTATRSGFLAAVRLEDAESGVYMPHEKTLAGPKADRLKLMHATGANLSPIFSLYDDRNSIIDHRLAAWKQYSTSPDFTVTRPDGFKIRMWRINDREVFNTIRNVMDPKSFYIADGHHRYETSLKYRDEMREAHPGFTGEEPWNFTLMYLVNMHSPGLTVLPTHRAVVGLENFDGSWFTEALKSTFDIVEIGGGVEKLTAALKALRGIDQAYGVYVKGYSRPFLLRPKAGYDADRELGSKSKALRRLDVTLLHSLILERILGIDEKAQELQKNLNYVKDAGELAAMVKNGQADVGFILNPTPVMMVKSAAEAGEKMPQKSTFFYPKLVTGLVINPLT